MNDDTLVLHGGEVKVLGEGKIGGYLVLFTSPEHPDLSGDYFDAKTDFGAHTTSPVLYHHGMDPILRSRVLDPIASLKTDDVGVWVEGQLSMRDEYERAVFSMAKQGKLGWSSGTAPHLVTREPNGKAQHITCWPLGLDASLTPTPCEPRTSAVPLKTWIKTHKSSGLSLFEKQSAIERLIAAKYPNKYPYICDLYEKSAVYRVDEKYYEVSYAEVDDQWVLGDPVEVVRLVLYKPASDSDKSLTGLSFDTHSEMVLTAIKEFAERARLLRERRERDGRTVTPEKLAAFSALRDELGALCGACETKASTSDIARVRRSYLERQAAYAALCAGD